jgi:glycosyltransferase involved in cell wall biosynthesis
MTVPSLLHVFSTFAAGGPELRAVALVTAFGGDFRHSVLSMDGRIDAAERLPSSATVRILPSPPRAGSARTAVRQRRLLQREKPDLVLTYNWGAFDTLVAALSVGCSRVVHHEDGFGVDEADRLKLRRTWARRLFLPRAARVIVPSFTLASIARREWKVPESRLSRIPNGVDPDAHQIEPGAGAAVRDRYGIPRGAVVVGSVGHLRPEKNFVRLLEAAATSGRADLHVLLVGDGEERERILTAAWRLSMASRVHLAGHHERVGPLLDAMDVFAMSSDTEQMPVSLLEAMARGLPVAATDVGDIRLVLPPIQHRYLVSPNGDETTRRLGRTLQELLTSAVSRRSLGAANREMVISRYSFDAMQHAYRRAYESALGRGA